MTDFYNLDSVLSEEERAVRDTIRAFVDEKVLPIIGDCYIEGRFPKELVPEMAKLGMFGANLPEEYGCAGLNNVAYGLIMHELERGDSGVRSFASVQGALVMYPVYAFGTEEQKRHFLPKMASGEIIGCFGLTEPDYGSNPSGMITRAREQKDGSWVINGAKMWITNGSTAQVAIIWAKTGDDKSDKSIRGFIVPTDTPGVHREGPEGKALAPRVGYERAGAPGRESAGDGAAPQDGRHQESRSCASPRPGMASPGARWERRRRATRKRSLTPATG